MKHILYNLDIEDVSPLMFGMISTIISVSQYRVWAAVSDAWHQSLETDKPFTLPEFDIDKWSQDPETLRIARLALDNGGKNTFEIPEIAELVNRSKKGQEVFNNLPPLQIYESAKEDMLEFTRLIKDSLPVLEKGFSR